MSLELNYRQLESLIHVSNVLNSSLDTDEIIDLIMKETISVIDAADSGLFFVYEEKEDVLRCKSTYGPTSRIFANVTIQPGESMTGKTFQARRSLLFPNRQVIEEIVRDTMSEPVKRLITQNNVILPYSALCAPVMVNQKCIGVITIDSFDPQKMFKEDDVRLLKAISHQAAVILEKAKLYREQETAIKLLEDLNTTITKQNAMLKRSMEIHNQLANLVLHGEGISAILQFISEFVNSPVLFIDHFGVGISSTLHDPIHKQVVEKLNKTTLFDQVFHEHTDKRTVDIDLDNGNKIKAVTFPIGTKPNFLGMLMILSNKEIDEINLTALEHASTVILLELVKQQAIFETEHNLIGQFIEGVLSGNFNDQLKKQAQLFHLDKQKLYQVITVSLEHFYQTAVPDDQSFVSMRRHLIKMARQTFFNETYHGIVVEKHTHLIILLSSSSHSPQQADAYIQKQCHVFLKQLEHPFFSNIQVLIGVGRACDQLDKVHKSSEESLKCIQFIRNFNLKKDMISYADLGAQRLFLQNSEEELHDFIQEKLGPLIHYERQNSKDLLITLIRFLENKQRLKETSKALHIHLNTLSYRLKRIEEILNVDLNSSNDAMDIHIAVHLYKLFYSTK